MAAGAGIHRRQIADRQISPKKIYLSLLNGTFIEEYLNYQPHCTAPNGFGDPSGVDTESFRVRFRNGGEMLGTYIGTGTQLAPLLSAGVLQLSLDEVADDGVEYNPGVTELGVGLAYGPMVLTRGAQAPHFVRAKLKVVDVSEIAYAAVGYRAAGAVVPVFDNYEDAAIIRLDNGNIKTETISNNAATTSFDTLQDVVDNEEFELKAVLENFGVRFFLNGKEYGSKFPIHADITSVIPMILLFQKTAGAGSVISCSELEAGFLSDVDDHRIL